jgi:hypothetical protein
MQHHLGAIHRKGGNDDDTATPSGAGDDRGEPLERLLLRLVPAVAVCGLDQRNVRRGERCRWPEQRV